MEDKTNISDNINNENVAPDKGNKINNDPKPASPEVARPTPRREIDVDTDQREIELPPKSDVPNVTTEYRWNY
jgi:hypothetical protein